MVCETLGFFGFLMVAARAAVETVKDPCTQEADQGPCQSYVLQWYWDPKREQCRQFYYGGCLGNRNRFTTKTHCLKTCVYKMKSHQTPDVCFEERDPGYCNDERLGAWHWTFDAERGECEKFYFYGCGGNHNRFATAYQCKDVCGDRLSPRVEACSHCDERTSFCKENAKYNYTCECREGFVKNRYGKCVDLDECRTYKPECDKSGCEITIADCHKHAECLNTMGSYRCKCMNEYRGDGKTCSYVGLGRSTTNCRDCHEMATCEKGVCQCILGYRGDGFHCKDVNECSLSPYPCHEMAACENTVGSFICKCRPGFAGNGYNCTSTTRACLDKFDREYKEQCTEGSWRERYWFNHDTKECELFWYDGCRGSSRNIFTHLETCQFMCEKTNVLSRAQICWDDFDEHYRDECAHGQWTHRYYFEHSTKTCTQFWYDHCEGTSRNMFQNLVDCQWMCEAQPMYKSRACLEDFDPHYKDQCTGLGEWASRYFYDKATEKCEAFWYDGCQGQTQNFFLDEASCVGLCEKPALEAREETKTWQPIGSIGVSWSEANSNDSILWNVVPKRPKAPADVDENTMDKLKWDFLKENYNYTDENETMVEDIACTPNPCKNKGNCKAEGDGKYHCDCKKGYKGKNCEKPPINPCESNPCQNGGTCSLDVRENSYWCDCPKRFVGLNCEMGLSMTKPTGKPMRDNAATPRKFTKRTRKSEGDKKSEGGKSKKKQAGISMGTEKRNTFGSKKAGTGGKLVQKKNDGAGQKICDVKLLLLHVLFLLLVAALC